MSVEFYIVETAGIRPEFKAHAFKIKKMIEKKFGVYSQVIDDKGQEVSEFEDD